jgi:hypothetical protein
MLIKKKSIIRQESPLGGIFRLECRDKKGRLKWIEKKHNLMTLEGLDHCLNVLLHGTTPITTWYIIPFESDTTILNTFTYATPGFTECTAYTEGTRPEYVETASSAQSITSASVATCTFNATKTIYGAALVGGGSAASTKGNTNGGGVLLCAMRCTPTRSVVSGDIIRGTYTMPAYDDGV